MAKQAVKSIAASPADGSQKRSPLAAFFNSNLAVLITAIISVATVSVSYLQVMNAGDNNRATQNLEKLKADRALEQSTRDFQMKLAELLINKIDDFITDDARQATFLREVVINVVPSDVGAKIAGRMADSAQSDELRAAWADTRVRLELEDAPPVSTTPNAFTVDEVAAIFPQFQSDELKPRLQQVLDAAAQSSLDSEQQVALLLANLFYESSFLQSLEENLNYSQRALLLVFPRFFKSEAEAEPYVNNPEALANLIYANRLGNNDPGDGWRYRGRGYLMTTGKSTYAALGNRIGMDLVNDPDLLLRPDVAARAAVALFASLPDNSTLVGARRGINGGTTGLAQVQSLFEKLLPPTPSDTAQQPTQSGPAS